MTINPSAQVPVLKADGIQISESVAIMEYLEETRPETPLLPKAPSDRATVRRIVEMINAGIQPKQNLAVLNFLLNEGYCDDAKRMKFAAHWNEVGLRAVEKVLEECSGKFCVGDEVTFADCCLVPGYYSAKRFKVDVDQFPVICKIVGELEKLSAVLQAHPSQQPDAE